MKWLIAYSSILCTLALASVLPINNLSLSPALLQRLHENPVYKKFNIPEAAIEALLSSAITTSPQNKNLPTDISFICADIKYNQGIIKFCECGNAIYMAPTSTSQITINETDYTVTAPYWGIFWHYLKEFNLPLWFVGNVKNEQIFAFEEFKKLGGILCNSFEELETHERFTSTSIIVYHVEKSHEDDSIDVQKFKDKHPEALVVSHPAHTYVNHKDTTYALFWDAGLEDYLPQTEIYPTVWQEDLPTSILKKFSCDYFIIKPTRLSCSKGVLLVSRDQLQETLKKGFTGSPHERYKLGFNYWHNQTHFIVSEFVASQTIYVHSKPYDPTMRLVFALSHHQGIITFFLLGGFWKIPTHALDEQTTPENKHITRAHQHYINSDLYFSGISIESTDMSIIKHTLAKIMPRLYETILLNKTSEHVANKKSSYCT